MKVGDMVTRKHGMKTMVGIVVRLFEIKGLPGHSVSLPMAELITTSGLHTWKRRKLQVISESR